MSPEKTRFLLETYPELFRNRGDLHRSLMAFGFECDDGWYVLIHHLLAIAYQPLRNAREALSAFAGRRHYYETKGEDFPQYLVKQTNCTDWDSYRAYLEQQVAEITQNLPEVVQVKEKFGTLRFYVNNSTSELEAAIGLAESLSAHMCEVCGAPGHTTGRGWVRTLCAEHIEEAYGKDFLAALTLELTARSVAKEMGMAFNANIDESDD